MSQRRFLAAVTAAVTAAGMLVLLLLSPAQAVSFVLGPSVRVIPNVHVEIEWSAEVEWFGKVEVFTSPDGTGSPVITVPSEDASGSPIKSVHHVVTINVGGAVQPDHGYFFRVTMTDPSGSIEPLITPTPLPPFFSGAQAIGTVTVEPGFDSAVVSWGANVIGLGAVTYGAVTPDEVGPFTDTQNTEDHSIGLTGLQPGTTYQFRVSNRHVFGGDSLAEETGTFTTLAPNASLIQARARPSRIAPGQTSMLSVLVVKAGSGKRTPVEGVSVLFEVLPGGGTGTIGGSSSGVAESDAQGRAAIPMQGGDCGQVQVSATSPAAVNSADMAVVVNCK